MILLLVFLGLATSCCVVVVPIVSLVQITAVKKELLVVSTELTKVRTALTGPRSPSPDNVRPPVRAPQVVALPVPAPQVVAAQAPAPEIVRSVESLPTVPEVVRSVEPLPTVPEVVRPAEPLPTAPQVVVPQVVAAQVVAAQVVAAQAPASEIVRSVEPFPTAPQVVRPAESFPTAPQTVRPAESLPTAPIIGDAPRLSLPAGQSVPPSQPLQAGHPVQHSHPVQPIHPGQWQQPAQSVPPAWSHPRFQINENFLGRNILPILAAALGLAGLIFLGVLVVPLLPDALKILLMFLISAAVGVLGYFLNSRQRSVLARALVGTGIGGVFIAILVTYLFFHVLGDIAAFALLACWIVASLWLAKRVNSLLIASLAHAGMVASVATALLGGMSDDKLIMVLVYQIAATLAVILGNILWVRSMYRFGLAASQTMIVVSLSLMWRRFMGQGPGFASTLPAGLIVASFLVQFLGATAIAYLLFVSCARVRKSRLGTVLSVVNSLAWLAVVVESVTVLLAKLQAGWLRLPSSGIWSDPRTIPASLAVSLVVIFLPVVAIALVANRVTLSRALALSAVVPLALASGLYLVVALAVHDLAGGQAVVCSWFIALAAAYLLLGRLARFAPALWIGWIALILDALLMLLPGVGYASLVAAWGAWAGFGYLVVSLGLGAAGWLFLSATVRQQYASPALVGAFVGCEISCAVILAHSPWGSAAWVGVLVSALLLALVHWLARNRAVSFFRVVELATAVAATGLLYHVGSDRYLWYVVFGNTTDSARTQLEQLALERIVAGSAALVVLLVILADRIRLAAKATSYSLRTSHNLPSGTAVEVLTGLGLTIAVVGLLTPYGWFIDYGSTLSWGYPPSLACMAVALVIVGLGLWSRVKPLRLYGLVVVIACVLKLVTLDLGSVNSITRVVAFLGGAAICFGISALYNFTARYFDKALAQEIPLADEIGAGPVGR